MKLRIFIALVSFVILFAGAGNAYAFIIFQQDFEDYSVPSKDQPSEFGWQGAVSALSIVSSPAYGNYSMKYTDLSSYSGYEPYHTFPSQSGILKVSMDLRKDWGSGYYMIYVTEGSSNSGMNIYMGSDYGQYKFSYYDGSFHDFGTYSYDTWYHIDFVADIPANTYDIYINGVLKVDDANFREKGSADYLNRIKFGGTSWGKLSGYIDNISISVIPEPATFLLFLSGLMGIWTIRRRIS